MIFDNDQNKNVALECKEFVRYLGIIIDNNLSWKHHIDHVAIKMSRTVGLICKLRHFLPRHTLLTIYRSLVAPYYFGRARSKGFATLRKVSKLHFFDKIGQAKSVGFRFYSAIWRTEGRVSSRYLEITSISLIYSLTFSKKKELYYILAFPGLEPTHPCEGVNKSRNMEHPGTFRNIPEHEKIKIFFYEKIIN